MSAHLESLQKDYREGKIVPFIGSGLSVPFKVPTWGDLIRSLTEKHAVGELQFVKKVVESDLERNDYWGAIDALKRYALIEEEDIQEGITDLIQQKQIKLVDNTQHNYSDLAEMDFKFYLTTNYENLLHQYLKYEIQPILLKDIQFNTQEMLNQKRVCQLHGTTSNYGTIVISKDSYQELYENEKYDNLLKLVTGSKKLLFMGFSFDDQFFSTLIRQHKEYFKSKHYIILANPSAEKIKELRSEYGLLTIPYKTDNTSHEEEIRKILNQIAKPQVDNKEKKTDNGNMQSSAPIAIGAGLKDFNRNVEENLFYKKLEIENIDNSTIQLCSAFYVASEQYIRDLQHVGISLNVIEAILGKVFIKYKELYADTYEKYGDSKQFLSVVHESLVNFNFGRHALLLKDNESDENENRGLIHILAENEEMDVWWGEERLGDVQKQ